MNEYEQSTLENAPDDLALTSDLPPGNHPNEIAARAGFGPLSTRAQEVWHGESVPCVSCGQLVRRGERECDYCGQDLSPDMIDRMRAHAGPWYVLEHVRPFPGVSIERIIRQIRRGVLTETSIIRGPATDHQWRFAVETPGICRMFGRCWSCHAPIQHSDVKCPVCRSAIDPVATSESRSQPAAVHRPAAAAPAPAGHAAVPPPPQLPDELARLKVAIAHGEVPRHHSADHTVARIGPVRAAWFAALIVVAVVLGLLAVAHYREQRPITPPRLQTAPPPQQTAPAPTGPARPAPAQPSGPPAPTP